MGQTSDPRGGFGEFVEIPEPAQVSRVNEHVTLWDHELRVIEVCVCDGNDPHGSEDSSTE